jgi:hypothetical protein
MQLYPHWLDGEFVRIASEATGPTQTVGEMVRALKLHAILGTQFILNDVQIFDSLAVLKLFSDSEFRRFVKDDRNLLDLRVDPDQSLGDKPFALAARGFTRTRASGWISSAFPTDPTPIKKLADEIINEVQEGYLDLGRQSDVAAEYPQHEELLNAARYAVDYFASCDHPQKLAAKFGERTSYYRVLCDLRELPEERLNKEDRPRVEETLEFIDDAIKDPDARKARSRVLAVLGQAGSRAKQNRIWNQVVQAWNYATQQTLRPEGGSVGTLPGAVSPAPYFDSPRDVLVPIGVEKRFEPMAIISKPLLLPCDLDAITWTEIGKARKETADTMGKLSKARRKGSLDEVAEPLREHLDAVNRILTLREAPKAVNYAFMIGGILVAAFGSSPLLRALISTSMPKMGNDLWQWRRRHALTSTLFQAAIGQPE